MSPTQLPELFGHEPIDEMFRGFLRPLRWGDAVAPAQIKLDIKENESDYVVKAEIPGVRKEDIDVRIDGNQVSLAAEVKKDSEQKDGERVIRRERYVGYVSRSFSLASDVDQDKAVAKYQDGVLELTLPKRASSKKQRLTIA